ncbi:MG2 domain-containing protein [Polyangium sorediatum]|uniref:MG2 domain-containing protein n=1 Tax=Polyangium sorediatum TaxID=889274 RepID=A0ABT6NPS4_9BACT|nr:Ig-like domain-containing alpha-2-macroglobulin family protein [Polyangium sorediatum]MDI1430319.1 MG2 domain-containing protein [Polyangium sorediatum]
MTARARFPGPRNAFLAVTAMALGMACMQGNRPPEVAPRGTLVPGAADGAGTVDTRGAFAVVFGTPRGDTNDPPEVSLVFNRPMRPLELAGDESTPPATIQPAVPGRWQWVGTNALSFVPEKRLPRATAFVVTVPAGTKALDGSALEKPFELRFTTARPEITSIDPSEGSDGLRPDAKFTLRFNQPVDERELEKALKITAGERQDKWAFTVKRPDPQNDQLVEITPRAPLPLDSEVVVEVKGLAGKEGSLRSEKEQRFEFRTYGPLAVKALPCDHDTPHGKCAPDGGIGIYLTNPVTFAELKKAVRFEPKIDVTWPSWLDDEHMTAGVTVYGAFVPGKAVKVVVGKGLRDVYGQKLAADHRADVAFDDLWPKADIGLRGSVFEPAARREIPIDSINTNDLELVVAPLTPEDAIHLQDDPYGPGRTPSYDEILKLPGAKVSKLPSNAPLNKASRHAVKIEEALGGKDARGAVALGIRYIGWPGSNHQRAVTNTAIAKVSDLAVSGKLSTRGSLLWISRLSSAEPVKGAEVTIETPGEAPLGPLRSDDNGFIKLPPEVWARGGSGADRAVLLVKDGKDWTYKHLTDTLDTWRFDVQVDPGPDRPFGLVFTDRGIYRPGDTVHIKGIFRKEGNPGTVTPVGLPVEIKVEGPDGDEIVSRTETLSPFGTTAIDVVVPRAGRLGTYSVRATVQEGNPGWADVSGDFEVAEYRPAEFAVSVESDKPSYVRGDKGKWIARGDYLYGAPMAGAEARVTVTRGEADFRPPNTDDFTVSEDTFHADFTDRTTREGEIQSSTTKLDAKGTVSIEAALALPGQRGPERVTAEAEVNDVSRQYIAGSTTAIVHPAEFYVALRTGSDLFVDAGKPVNPEVFAVDPKGARVAGVPIKIELVSRTWTVARQATAGGLAHTVAEPVDRVVESCTVTTTGGDKPVSCKLTPAASGYHIVHATAVDARKNPVGAADPLYVFGGASGGGFGDSDRLAVELVADKESYEIGDKARFLVKSPFAAAEALVTVERAGILSQRRVKLVGAMPTVEIPVTEDLRPNAFVSVLLVRGRTKPVPTNAKDPDVGAPAFRMGYAPLLVNPEKRRLKIALTPNKTEAKPGENVEVDVVVRDHAGKPARAEVTFYAVDEGVLSLIGYKTPDPIGVFGAPRPLRVTSLEVRAALARVFRPYGDLGADKGLDGGDGGGGTSVRRDFRASATFVPSIVTDDAGRAKVKFRLPDTLTTYRLMAVTAAEDDRFGFAENRVVASRPLMARPALPRFLRAGDALDASVVLSSKGIGKTNATVEIKLDGLTLSGDTKRTIDLAPGTPVEVRFPVTAPKAGKAKIGFVVRATESGKALEDAVEVERDVRVPLSPEAVALYGDTTTESAEKLGDLSAMRDDTGGLEVSMASTALVGLGGGVEQLIDYPYGCTEQLVSKLVPMLPLRDLAADFKIPLPKNTGAIIESTVAEILKHQRGDGGFGMWAGSDRSNLWATTYALWGLGEAKRRNVNIPETVIESAARHVSDALEKLDDEYSRAAAPFILDVLAVNGQPDTGRTTRLFEERKTLPLFAQAFLAHAMVVSKHDRASIDQLANELEGSLRLDGNVARAATNLGDKYAVLMDSDTRTTALILRALLAARPNHPIAAKLAMGLLADRKGGSWRNTQESAWSLVALDAYRKAQEKATPDFLAHVFLGQAEIATQAFRGRDVNQARIAVPADRLTSAGGSVLAFDVEGSGRLFYEARLRYARKELPKAPLDRGFFVQKTLRPVTPAELAGLLAAPPGKSVSTFPGGELVLGEIVVVTPSPRDYVVVDDPLPAGFEPVDARLATTASGPSLDEENENPEETFDEEGGYDAVATGRAYLSSRYLRELRDDRVLFFIDRMPAGMYRYRYLARATSIGTFILPPARAEEMYAPEVFGRTAAGAITVTASK